MKVIKVIVDELPKGCNWCPFVVVANHLMCIAIVKTLGYVDDPMTDRPGWCPLVLKESEEE